MYSLAAVQILSGKAASPMETETSQNGFYIAARAYDEWLKQRDRENLNSNGWSVFKAA